MVSRLAVTTDASGPGDDAIRFWHTELAAGSQSSAPPACTHLPVVMFSRPDEHVFKQQLDLVHAYADLRPDRASEILEQISTPLPFLAAIGLLRPDSKRWTIELLDAAFGLAQYVEYRIKHALACRRPIEYSPQIQPMILTPGHGALPSGHATESFMLARVFWELIRHQAPYREASYGEQLMRLASRIAINRTVAGLHFPIDSIAGALLGLTLAEYFIARAKPVSGSRIYHASHFDGTAAQGASDFLWTDLLKFSNPPMPTDQRVSQHPR